MTQAAAVTTCECSWRVHMAPPCTWWIGQLRNALGHTIGLRQPGLLQLHSKQQPPRRLPSYMHVWELIAARRLAIRVADCELSRMVVVMVMVRSVVMQAALATTWR